MFVFFKSLLQNTKLSVLDIAIIETKRGALKSSKQADTNSKLSYLQINKR